MALGSELLDGLTVNNEWGDSWLISEVVSLSDTQLVFQWGLQQRRQHANNKPTPTFLKTSRFTASQPDEGQDVNRWVHSWWGGEKNGFWTYKWEENYVKMLSVKVQDNRNTAYKKNSEKTFRSLVSLSLRTKCLDCLSGTQGCTYINTHTPKHRHKNTHTQVTAVAGCAAFCHLPGFPTPVLNVNSFILLYLEEVGEWWGEQKHQTTKKVPNNAAIFAASTAAVSFSSPSSSSLSLPLCPPFHIHTPA